MGRREGPGQAARKRSESCDSSFRQRNDSSRASWPGPTVNGWLGHVIGIALGGRTVSVLERSRLAKGRFGVAATVTTPRTEAGALRLPAGRSRVVEAVVRRRPRERDILSAQGPWVRAREGSTDPRRAAAGRGGGTVQIVGQLKVDICPPVGALVRLANRVRIGIYDLRGAGARDRSRAVLDGLHVRRGRTARDRSFWFQIASLRWATTLCPGRQWADVGARRRPSGPVAFRLPAGGGRFCRTFSG